MHTDPEVLAMLALGDHVGTRQDRVHVRTCPVCAAELKGLLRVADLARGAMSSTMSRPGPQVWATILRELGGPRAAGTSRTRQELRAYARLVPVEGSWVTASGEAELATDEVGRRVLQVTLPTDLHPDGLRQAWLVHRDDPARRQSVGILDGRYGLWTVEHALDLEEYPILEISQQRVGSTQHSGQTIVRGELVAVV